MKRMTTQYIQYTVQRGDALWMISQKFHVTVNEIKQLNRLTSDIIYPGQNLKVKAIEIEGGYIVYTVVAGDTLGTIAYNYTVTVSQIKQLNRLTTDTIYPGQILKIGEEAAANYIVYTVVAGDSLWGIATKYQVTVDQLKQLNGLPSDTIYPGQILTVKKKAVIPSKFESHGNLQRNQIALTFDAGSDIAGISILDVLKKHNVRSTFFLTGRWVELYPDYAKRIAAEGHEIGSHSYSHPDFTQITYNQMLQEIGTAERIIQQQSGENPRPLFRFPFGSVNPICLKAVGEAGYPYSIQWSIDTLDWQQPAGDVIVSRIETNASAGDIVLMHIGGINTPNAVDQVIPFLKSKGFELVKVSEILS